MLRTIGAAATAGRPTPEIMHTLGSRADLSSLARINGIAHTTRILVADDHEVVRCGLRTILETRPGWTVVAEASDHKSAIAQAIETRPDVAIVDATLPVIGGIEVTRQIRARCPKTEVLALAVRDSDGLGPEFMHAGAHGYLLKSDPQKNVVAAVEALAERKAFFTGSVSKTLLDTFLSGNQRGSEPLLSPRERLVVQLIAEGHSNKEMSAILCLSVKTIESHRAAAMRKLEVTSTAGLVRYAVRSGLVEA
jgi:DNA-binding NarL/FixJ family response regulator